MIFAPADVTQAFGVECAINQKNNWNTKNEFRKILWRRIIVLLDAGIDWMNTI